MEALFDGLQTLFHWQTFLALLAGVMIGCVVGIVPGLNGIVGVSMLLPFTFSMPPEVGLPLVIGLISVTTIADTLPCVLIGTPGTAGSQATVLDGYPMAQNGEAGKALGAAFFVSAVGGVFGAILLSLSIPLFKQLAFGFGSAEFLAMSILGLSMVAVLSGRNPLLGMASAGLGMLIAMIGLDPVNSLARWTFGSVYLLDGMNVVAAALGLFALPELLDLQKRGKTISKTGLGPVSGKLEGVREALRYSKLVGGSSLVGALIGLMPGLGTVVSNWMGYSLAFLVAKDKSKFGKGDIRGVIGPESANSSSLGGSLIPTLVIGIPGSAVTALVLAAFWMQGLTPGPALLKDNLDLIYLIVWSVAVASIIGALLAYIFTDRIARLAQVDIGLLAPIVFMLLFCGALITTGHIGDIIVLLGFGALGIVMKFLNWPRPAFILGFVLLPIFELNFFQATLIYGNAWMLRPTVMFILVLAILGLVFGYRMKSSSGNIPAA